MRCSSYFSCALNYFEHYHEVSGGIYGPQNYLTKRNNREGEHFDYEKDNNTGQHTLARKLYGANDRRQHPCNQSSKHVAIARQST